jgi:hypothetical protein
MAAFPRPWALCGGWAVDAWVGSATRAHGDVDIAVRRDDLGALFEHLRGWQLIAHDANVPGDTSEPWDGRPLDRPAHIHARLAALGFSLPDRLEDPARAGFGLDFQVDDGSGQHWILSRDPYVGLTLQQCVRPSPWGLPAMVPQALLFFKALELRPRDERDFFALLPHLDVAQRAWLREAVVGPVHPWLAQLSP